MPTLIFSSRTGTVKLKKFSPLQPYLFEILRPFEFNQIDNIIKALDGQSGKYFYSKQYKLLINRDEIIIKKREIDKPTIIEIDKSTRKIENVSKSFFYLFIGHDV